MIRQMFEPRLGNGIEVSCVAQDETTGFQFGDVFVGVGAVNDSGAPGRLVHLAVNLAQRLEQAVGFLGEKFA